MYGNLDYDWFLVGFGDIYFDDDFIDVSEFDCIVDEIY